MELIKKQRFKQTEVGFLPEDWDLICHDDIAKTIDSLHQTPKFSDSGFPMVRVTDIKLGYLDLKYTKRVSQEVFNEFTRNYLPKLGDIVMSRVGSYGVVSYVNNDEKFCLGQNTVVINPRINSKYLYYILSSELVISQIELESYGTGYKSLSLKNIKELKIPLPPTCDERKAIAAALSDVDDLIANLDKLISKKKAIKQGAMQQLLMPNENWINTSLIELAENKKNQFDDGDWIESEYIISQGVRLIQTGNIGIGEFKDKGNKKYISEESFVKLNCKEVMEGDLLICRLAEPAGRACVMPNIGEEKVVTSVDVSIFRGNPEIVNRNFLSQLFTTNGWFQKVIEKVGGTTHKRISRGALGKINIEVPQFEEQERISIILTDMDKEIEQLEMKKTKYQAIKQGMMQELLTGKTRLV